MNCSQADTENPAPIPIKSFLTQKSTRELSLMATESKYLITVWLNRIICFVEI